MTKISRKSNGSSIQMLFTMLLLFSFCLCSLFTILIGAQVYENIGQRMEQNFSEGTVLSYISNKVRQADESDMVSVETIEGTSVLKLRQEIDGVIYETLIYCREGMLYELFSAQDSGLTLEDGLEILTLEGSLSFTMLKQDLLEIEKTGMNGGKVLLTLRSGAAGEGEYA